MDRIEVTIGGDSSDLALKVDAGELDIVYDGVPPAAQVSPVRQQPGPPGPDPLGTVGRGPLHRDEPGDATVRRPELADRAQLCARQGGFRQLRGGPLFGELAGHIMVNSLQGDQLKDYDPYPSPNGRGDVTAAMEAMAASRYDTNGDGVCDDASCDGIVTIIDEADPYPEQTALLQQSLEPVGITTGREDVRTHHDVLEVRGPQLAVGPVPERVVG